VYRKALGKRRKLLGRHPGVANMLGVVADSADGCAWAFQTRLLALGGAAEKIFELPVYFFSLEYTCTDEGTNAFAYETG
jgi:hypothetical protein